MASKVKQSIKLKPSKYYRGLTRKQAILRKKEIDKFTKLHWTNPKAYIGFKTDKYGKTRKSSYTAQWDRLFPSAKSLKEKSDVTGVPLKYIDHVYRKGLGAWRTGHRPGANPQQWGYARVHSFLLCGKTHFTADAVDVAKAKRHSRKARKWFDRCDKNK